MCEVYFLVISVYNINIIPVLCNVELMTYFHDYFAMWVVVTFMRVLIWQCLISRTCTEKAEAWG